MGESERWGTYNAMYPGQANPYGYNPYQYGGGNPSFESTLPFPTQSSYRQPSGGFQQQRYGQNYQVNPGLAEATSIWGSMNYRPPAYGSQGIQVSVPSQPSGWNAYEANRSNTGHDAYFAPGIPGNRGAYGRGGGGGPAYTGPAIPEPTYMPLEAPTMPQFTVREYAPPEEDKGIYKTERRKAMGAGMRALRQRTQEATLRSMSLTNPIARKDFVRAALEGYGRGLENVAQGAGREARSEANRKRAEELNIYNTRYNALSHADQLNYQNEINRLAANFAEKQYAARQKYATQASAYLKQPYGQMGAGATGQQGGIQPTGRQPRWGRRGGSWGWY